MRLRIELILLAILMVALANMGMSCSQDSHNVQNYTTTGGNASPVGSGNTSTPNNSVTTNPVVAGGGV